MPSCISNSEPNLDSASGLTAARAIALLGLIVLGGLVGLELFCRLAIPRLSGTERRIGEEYHAVLQTGARKTAAKQLIVLGNSSLGEGIPDFDSARRALLPAIDARRFLVEGTAYYDWYYGLRRLFGAGARPEVVVLVLPPGQFVGRGFRGDFSAYHLLQTADLFSAAHDLQLSNTETSCLAIAHLSAFGGLRGELRKWVVGSVLRDLPQLTELINRRQMPEPDSVLSLAAARLQALRELAARFDARVILVTPPTCEDAVATYTTVQAAGEAAGVPVLVPLPPGSLPADHFRDQFHLSRRGGAVFTTRFVDAIRREVAGP
jgi:hypothetical protein